ncbi:MAG: reverse transcriptase, partial [Anaplasma sp.]|nr:reverse transcriptase [Anaplasma sp.]
MQATVTFNGTSVMAHLYVTKDLDEPLLGLDLIESFDILRRVNGAGVEPRLDPVSEYPELFQGLGEAPYACKIKLKSQPEPVAVTSPRRIPVPLLKAVERHLQQMESEGVITSVSEPTDWCSPIVVVPKKNGDIRICVDYTMLNKSVQREYHPIPSVEPMLATLGQARYFSRLDAYSGFYQVKLHPESTHLTTFITPFGRFKFNRLPFGISCAPEHFQRMMHQLLEGLDGVVCHIDDILVWAKSREEHDSRLREVLCRLKEKGLTLNRDKCVFAQETVKFLGHVINKDGVTPDKDKITTIVDMPPPTNVTELKRFLGMVNFIARFIPNLAIKTGPLRELLHKDVPFSWNDPQQRAFEEVKDCLTSHPVLALYCPTKETILSADASSFGLGAVLMQRQEDKSLRAVAYASKSLTEAEKGYSQIEKEALAITWACEKFKDYLIGLKFHVETDHKPLIPLFTRKPVDDLTPRLQRLRLRMMRYDYTMQHVPGKDLVVADALSRQPLKEQDTTHLAEEVADFEQGLIRHVRVPDV